MRRAAARTWILPLAVVVLALAAPSAAAIERSRVYIVLIDGLDASVVSPELTPTLWKLGHDPDERATFYPAARAVLPSVTNTNHVSILTATYPAAHGIVGNVFSERTPEMPPVPSEQARFIEVETLFTVLKRERPALVTAGLFGKSRLIGLFADVAGRQRAPDVLWGDPATENEPIDPRGELSSDQRTMDETLQTITSRDPTFLFAALPDFDRTAHVFGPDSNQARRAALEADRQVGRLIAFAKRHDSWEHTVLMVTADHGFQSIEPRRSFRNLYPLVFFGRELARSGLTDLIPVSEGGMEFVSLTGPAPHALDASQAQRLRDARALALSQAEIEDACYRIPNPLDGGDALTCRTQHPTWRLDHPRAGELVLTTRPHYTFDDPFGPRAVALLGDHGGPGQSSIPIIITGGDPRIRAQISAAGGASPTAENPDLGATAAWLLGVRPPRSVVGRSVPAALRGRVLTEAFR